jgi:hypothetical protein
MPAAAAQPNPGPPGSVDEPKHPLHALTTYELRDYRRRLESAIASFDRQDPVLRMRDRLQGRLDEVRAEQDERARLAANG